MSKTLQFGNGEWAVGKETALAYNDENSNFKPLPFTFDRGSSATVVNKQGLIETVGTDEPRIDFLNNTKGHLLLEPSRQNIITYSEDFSDSSWTKNNCTINSNNAISPDGTQNADKLDFTTSNGEIVRTTSFTSGQEYTMSFYAKTESGTFDFTYGNLNYSSINGTATTEWQRFEITQTLPSTTRFPKITATEIGSLLLWGWQVEQGSYATSYIPTQGSAVTRSAETCSGAGNDQVINSTEGVLYVDMRNDIVQQQTIALLKGSNDSVQLGLINGNVRLAVVSNGDATLSTLSPAFTYRNGLYNKYAIVWNNTNAKIFINGELKSTISTPSPLGLEYLSFNNQVSSENMSGNIKDIKVYNTALTDAELTALTS